MASGRLATIIGVSAAALCLVTLATACSPDTTPAAAPSTTQVASPSATAAPTPAASTTTAVAPPPPAPTTQAASPAVRNQMVCRVTVNGGTYYLNVVSFTEHDFRACSGATPVPGYVEDLLGQPNMDRRCVLDGDRQIAEFHALVGVYSDTKSANLSAARRYCSAHGGTN